MLRKSRKRTYEETNDAHDEIDTNNNEPPLKKRRSRILTELKSDLSAQMLKPKIEFDGPTTRYGRTLRRRTTIVQSQPLQMMADSKKSSIKSTQAVCAPQIASTNKRKVHTIFSIHKVPSNPRLRFVSNYPSAYFDSPIDKLIAINNNGLKTNKCAEANALTETTSTINAIDTVLNSVAAEQIPKSPMMDAYKCIQKAPIVIHVKPTQCKIQVDQLNSMDYTVFNTSVIIDRKCAALKESIMKISNGGDNVDWNCEWKKGDVVWAPKDVNFYWPAIVQKSRKYDLLAESRIMVKFLSDDGRSAWINANLLVLFNGSPDKETHLLTRSNMNNASDQKAVMEWKSATAEADLLLLIAQSCRMEFYDTVLTVARCSIDKELTNEIKNERYNDDFQHSLSPSRCFDIRNDQRIDSNQAKALNQTFPASTANVTKVKKGLSVNSISMNALTSPCFIAKDDFFAGFLAYVKNLMKNRFAQTSMIVDGSDIDFKSTLLKLWSTRLSERNQREYSTALHSTEIDEINLKTENTVVRNGLKRSKSEKRENLKTMKMQWQEETISSFILKQYPIDFLFKGLPDHQVCRCCLKAGQVLKCSGHCGGWYHSECVKHPQPLDKVDWYNALQVRIKANTRIYRKTSDTLAEEKIFQEKLLCRRCSSVKILECAACTKCDEKLLRCSDQDCNQAYHLDCLNDWPHKIASTGSKIKSFLCPSHTCHTCNAKNKPHQQTETDAELVKCLLCPASYHQISTCIPAGCEFLSKSQLVCPRHHQAIKKVNTNFCLICSKGDSLICCETCPHSYHKKCLVASNGTHAIKRGGKFKCEECKSGRMPLYGEIVWTKYMAHKLWPAIIVPSPIMPINSFEKKPAANYFSVYFFGTHNCGWLSRSSVHLFHGPAEGYVNFGKKKKDPKMSVAIDEANKWYKLIQGSKAIYPQKLNVKSNGSGVFSVEDISRNTFITEYVGELIDAKEYEHRFMQAKREKPRNFHVLGIGNDLFIDARSSRNEASFIRHSGDPNCGQQKWTVHGHTRFGFFAKKDIPANTELTFDYDYLDDHKPASNLRSKH